MAFLRAQGWDIDIRAHHRRGGHVLGLCGGYQMLGRTISDPHGIEGAPESGEERSVAGLGLLQVDTVLAGTKTLEHVSGTALGAPFAGYEMHMGITSGPDRTRPVCRIGDRNEGAISADGRVAGSYVHGLMGLAAQRAAWLARIGVQGGATDHDAVVDWALDDIAALLEQHLDIDGLIAVSQMAAD